MPTVALNLTFGNTTDALNSQAALCFYAGLPNTLANAKAGLIKLIKQQTADYLTDQARQSAAATIATQTALGQNIDLT